MDELCKDGVVENFNEQDTTVIAISKVLPLIASKELTKRQNECLTLHYTYGMTQREIADRLNLSQPTVAKHLNSGRKILSKFLSYCLFSVNQANEQWLKYF